MRLHRVLALLAVLAPLSASAGDLVDLFPGLVQQAALGFTPIVTIDGTTFQADPGQFVVGTFDATGSVDNLSSQIQGQFQRFPVGSTVAAFTFQFDPELNVFTRSTEGLGPLLSERAQTTGKGKINMAFAYSRVEFDVFEGDELDEVEVGYVGNPVTVSPSGGGVNFNGGNSFIGFDDSLPLSLSQPINFVNGGDNDIQGAGVFGSHPGAWATGSVSVPSLRTFLDAEMDVDVFALFMNYGVTDWLDVGAVVPFLNIDASGRVTTIGAVDQGTGQPLTVSTFRERDNSFGIGDVILRGKASIFESDLVDTAVRADLTLPTGDEDELRGYGDPSFGGTVILSKTFGIVSPHANGGLHFRTDDPDQHAARWAAGLDVQPVDFLTFTGDLIGEHLLDRDEEIGKDVLAASAGLKVNPWRRLVLAGNVVFRLNDDGLRADWIPSATIEYTFP